MKVQKKADSLAMNAAIPTRPRDGATRPCEGRGSAGMTGGEADCVVIVLTCFSLVAPVRVLGMLEIPQRAPARHLGQLGEVVRGRRRGHRPLKRPRVPRVVAGGRTTPQ